MTARLRILTLFLLAGSFLARGQDLRTGVATSDGGFLVAGEYLSWLDADGNSLKTKPLDCPLISLVAVGERLYALDTQGRDLLRLTPDGAVAEREKLPVKGLLRALSADGNTLWVVTAAGEIAHRKDASGWMVFDFNAAYDGFYPSMDFRAVAAGGGSVMVAGLRSDNTPAAYTSARGTVWSEHTLDYTDQGLPRLFTAVPISLSYDASQDRFYLMGTGGALLALPSCSHCNALTRYPTAALFARIAAGTKNLLLGSDGFRRVEER